MQFGNRKKGAIGRAQQTENSLTCRMKWMSEGERLLPAGGEGVVSMNRAWAKGQGCESMDTCEVAGVCGHMREAERRRAQRGMWGKILIRLIVRGFLVSLSLKKKKIQP